MCVPPFFVLRYNVPRFARDREDKRTVPKRILCVQLADIGDLVLTTPALAALRHALPHAHITLLTTPHAAPVVDETLVNEIITFDKHTFDSPLALANPRNWQSLLHLWRQIDQGVYGTIVFFHHFSTAFGALKFAGMALAAGSGRRVGLRGGAKTWFLNDGVKERGFGAMHQVRYWLRLAEVTAGERARPRAFRDAAIRFPAAHVELLEGASSPVVAMHAGSGGYSTARRWEPDKFAAVAQRLIDERGAQVVFVGTHGDDTPAVLDAMRQNGTVPAPTHLTDLTGKTTLAQLVSVLSTCDLFIGADSGVMHMAAGSGVPTVAIFGPSNHRAWAPWAPSGRYAVVRSAPTCSPCSYVGTGVGLREGCAARTCMKMVTADDVYGAAANLLDGNTPDNAASKRNAPTAPHRPHRVRILGVPVDKTSYDDMLTRIGAWIDARDRLHQICTVNPEFVMIAQRDPNFFNILNRVDLCIPDGVGLLYAARYLRNPIPERVTGSDGVPRIAERATQTGWRIFLLGAAEGVAERAADALRKRYPGVQIVGTYSGSPHPQDEDTLVERVNAANADILFVAYGAPQQDKWIARNAPRLNVPVAMGIGGTLDYLAGDVPLAPNWMRTAGLEWLFRLVRQPWRAKRQLRLPAFVVAVLLWRDQPTY